MHAVRVEATQPKLRNAMRVAATHPSNNTQWNEGGSDTPYTVIKQAMEASKLRWGGGPTQPRPQGFSLKKWVGREKALASAGHVSPRTL